MYIYLLLYIPIDPGLAPVNSTVLPRKSLEPKYSLPAATLRIIVNAVTIYNGRIIRLYEVEWNGDIYRCNEGNVRRIIKGVRIDVINAINALPSALGRAILIASNPTIFL